MSLGRRRSKMRSSVIWHDAECGGYEADLALWEGLAEGSILDLGCGTGRVATYLARRGRRVVGLDEDASLLAAFGERAKGLPAEAVLGDARGFELGRAFDAVIAPMQLVQLFEGKGERIECLRCTARHLLPSGLAACAIVEEVPEVEADASPLPDAREVEGWVYSSLPLDVTADAGSIVVRRLRQTVSPSGELEEEVDVVRLRKLSADALEREALEAGLRPAGRRPIPATDAHVGSTVVLLKRGA
jgi:SAM-dependent methyltransferase